jgi:aminoglycoside phosphotransferase (APT) family kinase protein
VDSEGRLRLVAAEAKLTIDAPIPLPSDSNEVWKIGELVVRICWWSTDRTRLQREALILEHLPDEVPHVRLADAGVVDNLSWTLTHWVPGTMLSHGWADLDRTQRRTAAEQLGHALRALHAWKPLPEVRAALAARPAQPDASAVIGADLNPLPVDRALRLVEPATYLENIDQQLVVQLGEQLERLRHLDSLTDPTSGAVVHGDANLNNVIWDGSRLALLDFEWARLGPPDLELQPLLPTDGALVRSLLNAYPAIVAHTQVVDRLWLYDLSATLRDLLVKAPLPATGDLPPWHPKRRLPMVLAGPGYIEALLSES